MTRKEFITNIVRDLGFEILEYQSGNGNAFLKIKKGPEIGCLYVWPDRSQVHPEHVSVKFKWCKLINDVRDSYKAVDLQRRTRAWLAQRGFEAVVDWPQYRTRNPYGVGYLRIRSIGFPWDQCAKAMTKEEALEDALTVQRRFRDTGNVLEED